MAISQRDTKILYIMAGLLIAYVFYDFGVRPIWEDYADLNADLAKQEEQYVTNQKILREADNIEEGYKRVEAQFPPEDPERDPEAVFSEEVTALVTQIVGRQPDVQPTGREEISKSIRQYQLLTFPIQVKGELSPVSNLMKAFDQKGYLMRNATIQRDSNMDKDELTLQVTLARIVKVPSENDAPSGPAVPGSLRLSPGRPRR